MLAYFDTSGVSNGGTEAINLIIEKVRRLAHGFRDFDHYRLRIMLAADGRRPYRNRPPMLKSEDPLWQRWQGAARHTCGYVLWPSCVRASRVLGSGNDKKFLGTGARNRGVEPGRNEPWRILSHGEISVLPRIPPVIFVTSVANAFMISG